MWLVGRKSALRMGGRNAQANNIITPPSNWASSRVGVPQSEAATPTGFEELTQGEAYGVHCTVR